MNKALCFALAFALALASLVLGSPLAMDKNTNVAGWIAGGLAAGLFAAFVVKRERAKKVFPKSILLLGDSLAVGLGDPMVSLGAHNGVAVDVHAISGKTAAYWQPQVQDLLSASRPDLLLVSLGTNDAVADYPAAYVAAIRAICETAKSSGVRIAWIAPPALGPLSRFPSLGAIRQAISGCSPEVIDVSADIQDLRSADGIHFSWQGYNEWARLIWVALYSP